MESTTNAETISKINELFEKWGVPDSRQTEFLRQALIALCQKELKHFADTDGGHYMVGPKKALIGLKMLTAWEF